VVWARNGKTKTSIFNFYANEIALNAIAKREKRAQPNKFIILVRIFHNAKRIKKQIYGEKENSAALGAPA